MLPPSVSVVIPTRNRPEMLLAAVRSALGQTLAPLEVIVVIDGEEISPEMSQEALAAVADTRLRVLPLAASVGGATARNLGVGAAHGAWIAFLDDDDQWLPRKLELQMAFAQALPRGLRATPALVLSCAVLARSPQSEEAWPRRQYVSGESMAEYLFCRSGWRYGEALLQTSTLLAPRTLLQRIPFADGLRKHQDWDWLLRVAAHGDVAVHAGPGSPQVIFHIGGSRASVSRSADWRFSFRWALERRSFFTARALAGFVATECAAQAARQGLREQMACFRASLPLVWRSWKTAVQFALFLCASQALRRRASVWLDRSPTDRLKCFGSEGVAVECASCRTERSQPGMS